LRELAKGKRDAAIIVDDIARPTPADRVLPFVIGELERGGIEKSHIKIIIGCGCHRPLTLLDMRKKLGEKIATEMYVANHDPFNNLTHLGETSRGTPTYINTDVLKAELKVGIGCVIPHDLAGFGGGAKIIVPGVAGIETIAHNHSQLKQEVGAKLGAIEENAIRLDMEEATERVGLDFIVNVVINSERRISGVFTGHFVKAHRAGVELCHEMYKTSLPDTFHVLLANAYPLDVYLRQSGKALWAAKKMAEDGIAILSTAANEGLGTHYLVERARSKAQFDMLGKHVERKMIIYSRNVGIRQLDEIRSKWHTKDIEVMGSWNDVVRRVRTMHRKELNVAVLPCGSIQF